MGRPHIRKRFKDIDDIVVYSTSSKDIEQAHRRACRLGASASCNAGISSRMVGFLGEVAVCRFLGVRSRYVGFEQRAYDILYKKQRIEVKSKNCQIRPSPEFSAFANGRKGVIPDNDIYFFTRVKSDYQKVYLCGWLPTPTFFDEAKFIPRGTADDSGFVFRLNGYHINISELHPAREFKKQY